MRLIKIRDGIVEVNDKPYLAEEVYVQGTMSGILSMSKSTGILGEIRLDEDESITFESLRILIIGSWDISLLSSKIEIFEHRRDLVLNMSSKKENYYEVELRVERSYIAISAGFKPRKLTIYYGQSNISLDRKPYAVSIRIRSPL